MKDIIVSGAWSWSLSYVYANRLFPFLNLSFFDATYIEYYQSWFPAAHQMRNFKLCVCGWPVFLCRFGYGIVKDHTVNGIYRADPQWESTLLI